MPQDIYIDDVIGDDFWGEGVTARGVRKQLDGLADGEDIRLRINSGGGSVFEAAAIVALCKEKRGVYSAIVDGVAASAASYIAVQAENLQMAEGSWLMLHNPHAICAGDYQAMQETAGLLARFAEKYAQIYAANSDKSVDEIQEMLDVETWLDDAEAVEAGFADGIADFAADTPKLAAIFQPDGRMAYRRIPDMARPVTAAHKAKLQLRRFDAKHKTA